MPAFDLRGIRVAKYAKTEQGAIAYSGATKAGDSMTVNLDLKYAEGRLYAESSLAEYMRKVTGGTISLAVKYIPLAAQKLMYNVETKKRSISYTPAATEETPSPTATTKSIESVLTTGKQLSSYVGVSFYAPDMIDGVQKYTCVLIVRCLFGQPAMNFQTAGENITFQTPTTTGEFLPSDVAGRDMTEVATVDTEEEAIAWTEAVLASE